MDKEKKEQRITVRFPFDVWQAIRERAKNHQRSFNGEIVWMVREVLKQEKKPGE